MKKNIVITGANSFIARHIIRQLEHQKYNIVGVVKKVPETKPSFQKVQYIEMDMEEYHNIDKYIGKCDCYLPFAWCGTKREYRNDEKINEKSYRCIFKSIQIMVERCGCSKVILPGTFSEYKNKHVPIDEYTPCDPELAYGRYKYQLYQEALQFCREKNAVLAEARLFSVYGPDDSDDKMINSMIQKMMKNEEISLTKAEQIWDFIHVDDVAAAFIKLMETEVESGCYNVATEEHRSLRSYIEDMKAITGSKSELKYGAISYGMEGIPHVICKTDKILHTIDWKPQISFYDGIKEMVQYYQGGKN